MHESIGLHVTWRLYNHKAAQKGVFRKERSVVGLVCGCGSYQRWRDAEIVAGIGQKLLRRRFSKGTKGASGTAPPRLLSRQNIGRRVFTNLPDSTILGRSGSGGSVFHGGGDGGEIIQRRVSRGGKGETAALKDEIPAIAGQRPRGRTQADTGPQGRCEANSDPIGTSVMDSTDF